ncbi:MAG: tetratricopeptide repeat protein [Planctomycetes bacterium]|nr:tetratricopeptide repeat protein [Planctomycetota bacterium]
MSDLRGMLAHALLLVTSALCGCADQPIPVAAARDYAACDAVDWPQLRAQVRGPDAAAAFPRLLELVRRCPEFVPGHDLLQDLGRRLGGEAESAMRAYYAKRDDDGKSPVTPYVRARLEPSPARRRDLLEEALRREPGAWFASRELGELWQQSGNLEAAFESYERAVRLRADDARANLGLSRVLSALGRGDAAERYFAAYLAAEPDDEAVTVELVRLQIYSLGKAAEAEPRLQWLLHRRPDDVSLWMDEAAIAWQRGQQSVAAGHYRRVLRADPDNVRAALNLGNLYYGSQERPDAEKLRDWPKARQAYRYLLSIDPGSASGADAFERAVSVPARLRQIEAVIGAPADPRPPSVSDL